MDKMQKFLRKLPAKELRQILAIINRLERRDTAGLDVKKLSDHKDIFRLRLGKIRIIFLQSNKKFRLVSVEKRTDRMYKF